MSPTQTGAEECGLRSLVQKYLSELVMSGRKCLPLEDDVRPILREWMVALRRGSVAPMVNRGGAVSPSQTERAEQVDTGTAPRLSALVDLTDDVPPTQEEEQPVFFRPSGRNREESWQNAQNLLPRWEPLRSLGSLREIMVWGEGTPDADIVFVGEAPNLRDEQEGRPFCGDAGTKLDEMLLAMGLSRQQVYITHLVKFRPKLPRQTTNNRPPDAEEIRRSLPVLEFEIHHIRPKVIVALGVVAARGIIGKGDLPLSAYRQMHDLRFCEIPVIITHNPSYLLRTSELGERRRLWEDMLRVLELAHLPVSAKQRGYFLPRRSE